MGGCQVDGLFAQLFYTFWKRHSVRLTLLEDPVNGVEFYFLGGHKSQFKIPNSDRVGMWNRSVG